MKLLFLVIAMSFIGSTKATTYYFSNTAGDDLRTSQQAKSAATPWKTLSKLNSFFPSLQPGDSVLFKRGDTFYGSFSAQSNVTYDAYGTGANPIITGLTTLTGWTSLGGGLYEKTLSPAPTNSLNLVLLNGALQPIGRYPKAGLSNASYYNFQSHSTTSPLWPNSSGVLNSNAISGIPNFVGGELVQRSHQWVFDRGAVTAQTSNSVSYNSMPQPFWSTPFSYEPMDGHGFFFQNHINTLTAMGEWAYNQTTKKITMHFGAGNPTTHTIQVATADAICTINSKTAATVQNISFSGANEYAFSLDAATYCNFKNLTVSHIGINGIDIDPSTDLSLTHHNTVDNCEFVNIINNGINANGTPDWIIKNSHVHNIALHQGMGRSGDAQYNGISNVAANSLVEYNHVENIGYLGIWFTGDNTIIRYNHVHHYALTKSDAGGIYTYGVTGTNRLVHKNVVHDGPGDIFGMGMSDPLNLFEGQVHGIYMDSYTTNVTITDNTSFNNANSGLWHGSTSNITATGNTFYDNKVAGIRYYDGDATMSNIVSKRNIVFAKRSGSLALNLSVNSTSLAAITSDSNYLCRPIWEPTGINSNGYSSNPPTWYNYTDGAVIYNQVDLKFKSLDVWKTYSGKDAHSAVTHAPATDTNTIRFEYNGTKENKTVILGGTYSDLKKNHFTSVTLAPYSSIILLKSQSSIKNNQTINFASVAPKTFGDAPFALSATASSGLLVSFRIVSGPATLSGSTVSISGAGTVTVEASQAGNDNYDSAVSVTQSFNFVKANQTINFQPLTSKTYKSVPFILNATASSALQVTFRVISGPATFSNNTVKLTGTGTVTIEASQEGNNNYNSAAVVLQSFNVAKANQTINFQPLASKTYKSTPFILKATASSALKVRFRVVSGPATLSYNTVKLTGTGTVTIEASQAGNGNYNSAAAVLQSFNVTRAAMVKSSLTAISSPSGIGTSESKIEKEPNINVFPNPFADVATIQISPTESGEVIIDVYDLQGRLVKQLFKGILNYKIKSFSLRSTGLYNGVYIIRVTTKTKVLSQKIILAK